MPARPFGLSVVVVIWNSADELPGLLASVDAHLVSPFELVVVDSGSQDGGVAIAEAWSGPLHLVRLPENVGFGGATNAGVREARHAAVVLLNPDTRLVDGSLVRLAELALSEWAFCGPELVNEDRSRQPSASAPPAGWEVGLQAFVPAALLPERVRVRCEPWRAERRRDVGWLTAACIAAPRELLLELGPFDESIHLFGEDLDLGLRARARGVRCIFAPDVARVVHLGGRSTRRRFGDEGVSQKLSTRRVVVRRHLGRARERYDYGAQVAFHATRFGAKKALGRDAHSERAWLAAAGARLRGAR